MVPDLLQENGPTDRVMTSSGPFLLFPWRGAPRGAAADLVVHGGLENATKKRPPELVRNGVPNDRRVERTIT